MKRDLSEENPPETVCLIKDKTERETERKWRDIKCISFTFIGDEFMPNPDAAFFKQFGFDFQEYLKKIKN